MTRWKSILIWALLTVVLSAVTCFAVVKLTGAEPEQESANTDFHEWAHNQLRLTSEQHAALASAEREFEREHKRLLSELELAGKDLATAVRAGDPDSPEIVAALGRVNSSRTALQKLTLDHFFMMKEHLDPEQAEKLLQWTHDSLLPE